MLSGWRAESVLSQPELEILKIQLMNIPCAPASRSPPRVGPKLCFEAVIVLLHVLPGGR